MRRAGTAAAATVVLALLAAGCAGDGSSQEQSRDAAAVTSVELDTPELRDLRREARLEPCRSGPGRPGGSPEGGLPALELPCFGAPGSVDLSTLRGPMVISVRASWCAPCRRELPVLQDFAERHAEEVQVLGIDYADRQTSNAGELLVETGASYPQLADPGGELEGADSVRVPGLPGLVLVDAEGRVVHQEFRELEGRADLERLVGEHLGVSL